MPDILGSSNNKRNPIFINFGTHVYYLGNMVKIKIEKGDWPFVILIIVLIILTILAALK